MDARCDGNIRTYGPSYLGFVQWAASTGAESLKAVANYLSEYYAVP